MSDITKDIIDTQSENVSVLLKEFRENRDYSILEKAIEEIKKLKKMEVK